MQVSRIFSKIVFETIAILNLPIGLLIIALGSYNGFLMTYTFCGFVPLGAGFGMAAGIALTAFFLRRDCKSLADRATPSSDC